MSARSARHRLAAVIVTSVLATTAACGGDANTPGEAVPELATALEQVDESIADRNFRRARDELNKIVDLTGDARDSGDLEPQQADRVLAAVAQLLSALPEPRVQAPEPEPETEAEPEPAPDEGLSEEEAKKQKELEKKLEEEQKKLEEELKKQQEEEQKKLEEEQKEDDEDG